MIFKLMKTPLYDNRLEVQLSKMLCELDENPKVCTNPVEASSYKGHLLSDTDQGFHRYIYEHLFIKFIDYIESFKAECINAYAVKTHFVPVVKRLLNQYNDAIDSLYASDIRIGWAKFFNETHKSGIKDNLKKEAYQFFYNASAVQISFLCKLVDKMKDYLAEFEVTIPKPEPVYYFTILPEFTSQRHNILYDIHKNLKANGYVDCTDEAFKKVFTTKEPKPIRWLESQRSLFYFIKKLSRRLLVENNKTSKYYIAERYFHIYKGGEFMHPKKIKYDKNPSPKVIEFMDKVIDDAISAFR